MKIGCLLLACLLSIAAQAQDPDPRLFGRIDNYFLVAGKWIITATNDTAANNSINIFKCESCGRNKLADWRASR